MANKIRTIKHPPRASVLIEAMRDIGYSFEAAVADIVDNSIAANARIVEVRYGWSDGGPWISIVDDGDGMSRDQLLEAMKLGSKSPLLKRDADDLGRFGLGLKTASFSQCRHLSVVTRKEGVTSAFAWDLDRIAETDDWTLIELSDREIEALPGSDLLGAVGTVVTWLKLDRMELAGANEAASHAALNEAMGTVRQHVARVYHRFLSGEPGKARITLRVNALEVEPFDPFHEKSLATDCLPREVVTIDGAQIEIRPFILPHHSKVSARDYERYAGRGCPRTC